MRPGLARTVHLPPALLSTGGHTVLWGVEPEEPRDRQTPRPGSIAGALDPATPEAVINNPIYLFQEHAVYKAMK